MSATLGDTIKRARADRGLSLREVERRTGVRSGHLSQIETGRIAAPEMAILWDLAALYELDFERLLQLAGLEGRGESPGRSRQRISAALRAMSALEPRDQDAALRFMAELKGRRTHG
jgi:transcriptional regulator with XRE-family HTH domain